MSATRDAMATEAIYRIVDHRAGLASFEPFTLEQAEAIMLDLEALDRDLAVPFAPDRLPATPGDAQGDALEAHAECMRVEQRGDLGPFQRAFLGWLKESLANVVAGLVSKGDGSRFAAMGKRDERARGWAAFLGRCEELQTKARR